jgi:N4-gp56 family major capsid protein
MLYNDPNDTPSSISGTNKDASQSTQFNTFLYQKKALVELKKEQYFSQMADTVSMPKNFGKTIKKYHYLPMLDERNINDQGIDAAGVTIATTQYYVQFPQLVLTVTNATVTAKTAGINDNINNAGSAETVAVAGNADSAGTGFATITLTKQNVKYLNLTKANVVHAYNLGTVLQQGSGNLYGSSKDVGTVSGKMPTLSEQGGRVNRVGFKRIDIEGSFEKFGFFDEYTQESLDFDTDAELEMHINREMLFAANEITEDALQIDLLNAAGVIYYGGDATDTATITGEDGVTPSVLTYEDFMKLGIELDNNRTPKGTKIITGSRMTDVKNVAAARYMFIGSELIPSIKKMKDLFNNPAFIPVHQYADPGQVANGEIGSVEPFRIVVVPEMLHWAGAGAAVSTNDGYRETGGRYDVFPMLVIGSESFTTIGFQTDGKSGKFKIMHKKPGMETADRTDPYGETGFTSIKWYYGFMTLRSERIALCKCVAEL